MKLHPAIRRSLLLVAVAASACAGPGTRSASPASVEAHVARATRLAGDDLKRLVRLCQPQPATRPSSGPETDRNIAKLIDQPPPEPGQAFDNLYFVGSAWVSAWLLKTSQGLILIDALNNEPEAARVIEGGMTKLALDPRDIKYIVITHGHGDHYGGAAYLAQKYGARVVSSSADWTMMESGLEFTSALWPAPPKRDIAVNDGGRITLGDTAITLYVTPGHTLGTLSPLIDVKTGGRSYKALLWGGTSFNFGKDFGRLDSYIEQTERMRRLTAELPIDVLLSNHAGFDGTIDHLAALRRQGGGGPNPFVIGKATVDRALAVMGECARAQRDRFRL